jgi:hypothetical protein
VRAGPTVIQVGRVVLTGRGKLGGWLVRIALGLLAASGSAVAQTAPSDDPAKVEAAPESVEQRARGLFEQGVLAVRAEEWQEAARLFELSVELVERPNALMNWAIASVHLGSGRKALEIIDRWFRVTGSAATPAAVADAVELRRRAAALAATLTLAIEPAAARLLVDGAAVAGAGAQRTLVLDPGLHEIVVSAPGFRSRTLRLTLERGQTAESNVALVALPSAAPVAKPRSSSPARSDARERSEGRSRGPLPYVLIAAGGGLLLAGATTGVLALEADRDVSEACPSLRDCDPNLESRRKSAMNLALATDILIGLGLPALGAGWLWLELEPAGPAPAEAARRGAARFGAGVRHSW